MQWAYPTEATYISGQGTTTLTLSYPPTTVLGYVIARGVNNCGISLPSSIFESLDPCPAGPTAPLKVTESKVTEDPLSVKVFPNPTTDIFNVQVKPVSVGGIISKEAIRVRVTDAQGRTLKEMRVSADQTIKLGSDLRPGAYMIEVTQGDKVRTQRVVKY